MCVGPLSTTDAISSLFLGNFAGLCMPQPISSSLMSRYVPNAEDSQCFQLSKMKKCEVDVKKEECRGCSSKQEQSQDFRYDCENLAGIAKISQS